MEEVFPVLAGIVVGLFTLGVRPTWLKAVVIAVLGVALGALASWISGELAMSAIYILIDAAQVIAAAVMTGVLAKLWLRRRARLQAP
jgi:demethoxyubiquinone hydroxylase (CLK1/Coq7/Cat5 family)